MFWPVRCFVYYGFARKNKAGPRLTCSERAVVADLAAILTVQSPNESNHSLPNVVYLVIYLNGSVPVFQFLPSLLFAIDELKTYLVLRQAYFFTHLTSYGGSN